jgi:hypothetical protein
MCKGKRTASGRVYRGSCLEGKMEPPRVGLFHLFRETLLLALLEGCPFSRFFPEKRRIPQGTLPAALCGGKRE